MKKLMFAAAAMAAGIAMADVTSANIVGYQNLATEMNESPSIGMTFLPVAGGETFKLGSVKAVDFDIDFDMLQKLDANTTAPIGFYAYCSKELADEIALGEDGGKAGDCDNLIGWWDTFNGSLGDEDYRMDNEDIDNGQAFLGLMTSGNNVKLVTSGEAPVVSTSIFTDMNESPFIASYIPRTLKLKQISCNDFDIDFDMLQKLDANTTAPIGFFAYCSKELADEIALGEDGGKAGDCDNLIGWWDTFNGSLGDEDYRMDNEDVNPGDSFLGLMTSGNDVEIMFPSSLVSEE